MGTTILHHKGAYNIYTSFCDALYWEHAITLGQLKEYYKEQYGAQGLQELDQRLERAHATGSSSRLGKTIQDCCRSLVHDTDMKPSDRLTYDEFILKYLTLKEG